MSRYAVRVARGRTVEVESLLAAGRAVRDEIEGPIAWIGSTEWYGAVARSGHGTPVLDGAGKTVARVSYNGRVWSPDGAEVTQ